MESLEYVEDCHSTKSQSQVAVMPRFVSSAQYIAYNMNRMREEDKGDRDGIEKKDSNANDT